MVGFLSSFALPIDGNNYAAPQNNATFSPHDLGRDPSMVVA
jgi:hypothetical protein